MVEQHHVGVVFLHQRGQFLDLAAADVQRRVGPVAPAEQLGHGLDAAGHDQMMKLFQIFPPRTVTPRHVEPHADTAASRHCSIDVSMTLASTSEKPTPWTRSHVQSDHRDSSNAASVTSQPTSAQSRKLIPSAWAPVKSVPSKRSSSRSRSRPSNTREGKTRWWEVDGIR